METGPGHKVSSDRLAKPGIEPATPGLQGKWLIHNTIAAPYAFAHGQTILFGLSEFVILVLHFNTRKLTCHLKKARINFEFNKFVKICKVSKTNKEY